MLVCFIADVPNWALDIFAKRLMPHLGILACIHYLHPDLDHMSGPPNLNVPPADVYYCTSWWPLYLLAEAHKVNPKATYLMDVVDNYSWCSSPLFALAKSKATVTLTQSRVYLEHDPHAVFHPYPTDVSAFLRGRGPHHHWKTRRDPGRLKVGMVTNKYAKHSGNDHKGIELARRVIKELPWCDLEVAGNDQRYAPEEMVAFYLKQDVYLTLSQSEAFSAALVDAITAGVPVIGTPVSPLHPFVPKHQYIQVTRDPSDVLRVLTEARQVLSEGGVLPTAFDVGLQWSSEKVASTIAAVIRGSIPTARA